MAISAGANHVLLVHRSGQLYTWGVGASGRLGLDLSEGGNPQVNGATRTRRREEYTYEILFSFYLWLELKRQKAGKTQQ